MNDKNFDTDALKYLRTLCLDSFKGRSPADFIKFGIRIAYAAHPPYHNPSDAEAHQEMQELLDEPDVLLQLLGCGFYETYMNALRLVRKKYDVISAPEQEAMDKIFARYLADGVLAFCRTIMSLRDAQAFIRDKLQDLITDIVEEHEARQQKMERMSEQIQSRKKMHNELEQNILSLRRYANANWEKNTSIHRPWKNPREIVH